MKFQSIYNFLPTPAVISPESEVKRDESLTISQIISLHLRGLPTNVHVYDDVKYEVGDSYYRDEQLNEDYYEMENDLSDFNSFVVSSADSFNQRDNGSDSEQLKEQASETANSGQFASEKVASEIEQIKE